MKAEAIGRTLFSIFVMILLLALLIGVSSLSASSNVIALPPTDDAEVRELSPDSNHGTSAVMWVQSAGCGKNRRTFMKFDLSTLPPGAIITEARLYLYCQVANSADLNVQVRAVDNDDWAESAITWSNQPLYGEVLDNTTIAKCASFRWYCWDVTSFVRAEFSRDRIVSFCLRADKENARGSDGFRSKEHGVTTTRPYLEVVYVRPVYGVAVSISPSYQSGLNGVMLTYTVTVANTGNVSDTYSLTTTDNAVWGPSVSPTSLTVPPGENRTATLSVTVHLNAIGCTNDNILVTATGTGVDDSDSCIAHVTILRGVQVVITPPSQENENRGTLTYTVTVKNTGNVQENFQLEKGDNTGWVLTLENTWLLVPKGENRTTKLIVNIPANATGCTWDNIWVKATSKENAGVFDNKSCLAHVRIVRGVRVVIEPSPPAYLENENGRPVTFTVTVINLGNVSENLQLTRGDNAGWTLALENNWLLTPKGENRATKLTVNIPENARGCIWDNIWVKATSKDNAAIFDNKSSLAHVRVLRGVNVSISPPYQSVRPGFTVNYTVTVRNVGNVEDTYSLTVIDSAGWGPTLSPSSLTVPPWENRTSTLSMTVLAGAIGCTSDNITVIATSLSDPTVKDNDSCIAHAAIVRGVQVLIEPPSQENENGGRLTYTVTVNNTGNVQENFQLTRGDNAGWTLALENNWLLVPKDENRVTKLIVNIPADATGCTWDNVWVKATSKENAGVFDNKSCLAHVRVVEIVRGVQVVIEPSYRSGARGSALSYTVTITNTGNVVDNYALTISDNENWGPTLDNNRFENVAPGENRQMILRLTIPKNAVPCTMDNITITAAGTGVTDSDSCIAHATLAPMPTAPTLLSPLNGKNMNENAPTFKWTCGENATDHRLLVDNDPDFLSPEDNVLLGATDNMWTKLAPGYSDENYSWKVIAINEDGENSSSVWTFLVDTVPPAAPALVWPANNENINDNTPNLDWNTVMENSLPVFYRVHMSDNSMFPYDNVDSGWTAADNFKLTTQLKEGVWYWRVQARDNAGNVGENSATRSFRVDVTPPPAPTLLEPADGAATTDNTPTFRWVAVADNSMPVTYRLQVDNDPGFSSPEIDVSRLTDNAYTPTAGLPHENYSWRVQARDNAGNVGAWSSVRTFLITVARGVKVTISPSENGGMPGKTLTYRVTVKNTGNVRDSYVLTVSDNMNWGPKLSDNRLDNVQPGENRITTLSITIPGGAVHDARDNIIVVATSLENAEVKDNASCIARAIVLGVSVVISPSSASGAPKQTLTYGVVVKNTGGVMDSYSLSVADILGWRPTLSDNRFENVLPGEERSTTLSVTVPENAEQGDSATITVRATSEVDPDVSGSAQCRAIAGAAPPVPLIPLALALILICAAIFAIYYFRHRARAVRRLRVLRNVAAASKTIK